MLQLRVQSLQRFLRRREARLDASDQARVVPQVKLTAQREDLSVGTVDLLADELQTRGDTAWLSTGATLLSANAATQDAMARIPGQLRRSSSTPEQERSRTIALGSDQREGWLFVWATRTAGSDPDTSTSSLRRYLQAKKYHLGLHRGTALVYDQATRILVDLKLRPIEASSAPLPPRAKGTNPRHPRKKRRRH
ncbi:hypothetical protein GCM10009724_09120 [Microbacterium lacticum]|nr:hypothetical protein MLA01_06580 [Microbacterium lacticum]GGN17539.1 hypothetical protein GCM10009724_09120 [Microbacterium lacticum]